MTTAFRHNHSLEQRISRLEEHLGLKTRNEILIEAALVIDRKFLDTAIIMGIPTRPERIFGDKEWAGYLEARLFARQYSNQPLTLDFITGIHQHLLDSIHPGVKSSYIQRGGRGGAYINGQFSPIECSSEQITTINSNPLLHFGSDKSSDNPNRGYIHYTTMSVKDRRTRLDQICVSHNEVNLTLEPYSVAARTQRNFISLHPLSYDFSGRVSRIIMNWSLENAGKSPSIVSNMENDLLLSEKEWIKCVHHGNIRYATCKERMESGETNPITLFNLQQKKIRYETHSDKLRITPPPLLGDSHNHSYYDTFLSLLET